MCIKGYAKLQISINGFVTQHKFLIADKIGEDIILGMDFLQQNSCVIDVAKQQQEQSMALLNKPQNSIPRDPSSSESSDDDQNMQIAVPQPRPRRIRQNGVNPQNIIREPEIPENNNENLDPEDRGHPPIQDPQIQENRPQRNRPERMRGAPRHLVDYYVNQTKNDPNTNFNCSNTEVNRHDKDGKKRKNRSLLKNPNFETNFELSDNEMSQFESAEDNILSSDSSEDEKNDQIQIAQTRP